MKLDGLVPNLYIHVSVSDLYIPTIGLPIFLQRNRWTWDHINCSQIHECGNWERGRAVPFLGIHKSDLVCSAPIPSLVFFSLPPPPLISLA
jgi:hypothetical protein